MGYFISFEGIDGSGKDTQIYKLAEQIKENEDFYGNKYSNIWLTREPTNITQSGKQISKLLLEDTLSKEEASNLFVKDRLEHTPIIQNALLTSDVLCSRYDLSTLSYQKVQGMDFDELYNMHKYKQSDGCIIPDITIVFDIPADVALSRINKNRTKKEFFEKKELLEKVIDSTNYCINKLKKYDNRNIIVVNANQPIKDVTYEMLQKLRPYLK